MSSDKVELLDSKGLLLIGGEDEAGFVRGPIKVNEEGYVVISDDDIDRIAAAVVHLLREYL